MTAIIVSAFAIAVAAVIIGSMVLVRSVTIRINRRSTDQIPQKTLQLSKLKVNPSTQSESVNECWYLLSLCYYNIIIFVLNSCMLQLVQFF